MQKEKGKMQNAEPLTREELAALKAAHAAIDDYEIEVGVKLREHLPGKTDEAVRSIVILGRKLIEAAESLIALRPMYQAACKDFQEARAENERLVKSEAYMREWGGRCQDEMEKQAARANDLKAEKERLREALLWAHRSGLEMVKDPKSPECREAAAMADQLMNEFLTRERAARRPAEPTPNPDGRAVTSAAT